MSSYNQKCEIWLDDLKKDEKKNFRSASSIREDEIQLLSDIVPIKNKKQQYMQHLSERLCEKAWLVIRQILDG